MTKHRQMVNRLTNCTIATRASEVLRRKHKSIVVNKQQSKNNAMKINLSIKLMLALATLVRQYWNTKQKVQR